MVSFRTFVTSALALAAPIAAQTASQVVSNINTLTQQAQALQPVAQQIMLIDTILLAAGQGKYPQIITGLATQTQTVTTYVNQMQGAAAITDATEATSVYDAFRSFVQAEQALLNVLIGKAGLANTAPFVGAPISAVLRALEGSLDAFDFGLIDQVPSRSSDLTTLTQALSQTLDTAIRQYSGIVNKRSLRFARREVATEA
ncbi:hypothetical protein DE146DRAFT_687153 [Phaeosphaeria sp. MPI-PUGE-AT-0046c]|nr:hypothetical protein DE146DRAFT_687153 [Phaeosphaeria sp. MPI-PUGE-AT-0046c]